MKGSIEWFAHNPVAANLFMLSVFVLGFICMPDIRKELIPNVSLERIGIETSLAGASVETIEATICKPIENQIYDIEGTLELSTVAREGHCSITLDVSDGYQTKEILDIVKSRLENYDALPSEAEEPKVKELIVRNRVSKLILSGTADYASLAKMARRIRSEILESDEISIIDLEDVKRPEIKILVPAHNLEQYQISFEDLSHLIKQQSSLLPGGILKSNEGDVLITGEAMPNKVSAYLDIIIASNPEGSELKLGDIAHIIDTRNSQERQASFDGYTAVSLDIYRVGNQNIVTIAEAIRSYVNDKQLPDNMQLYIWQDEAKNFKSRIDLLLENALSGLLLLFLILVLFLNLRLSFWVSLGIPFSFFGVLLLMPALDVSINIVSLFAFILVLGIVVDDAVIVGESIHSQNQSGKFGSDAALAGVYEVYKPILFAVATTIVAFLPLLFLPGPEGKLMQAIPIIVICILLFSLLESLFILPTHLSLKAPVKNSKHLKLKDSGIHNDRDESKNENLLSTLQSIFSRQLEGLSTKVYQPLLMKALKQKEAVVIGFTLAFFIFMVLLSSGWIRLALGVAIEAEVVNVSIAFPEGSPRHKTEAALNRILASAEELRREVNQSAVESGSEPTILHVYSVIGPKVKISNQNNKQTLDHTGQVTLELSDSKNRVYTGQEILNRWRTLIGDIEGSTNLSFSSSLNPSKPDINIELASSNRSHLEQATQLLKQKLATYQGTYGIEDSFNEKKKQVQIVLRDNAITLGLTLEHVIKQVNRAYQGEVVQTVQTIDDELDVWLGLPEEERRSMWYLEHLPIQIPTGDYVKLDTIADIHYRQAPNYIRRFERNRVATVSSYVNTKHNSVYNIQKNLKEKYLDNLIQDYPGMTWGTSGKQKSIAAFLDILLNGYLIAILVMYLMMAILFSSYSQPILVLFAIPFGVLGSLIGHMLLGLELTLWSFIGMVAVSGIVINDNLVLMDNINAQRAKGVDAFTAVREAGRKRFRPILLTSITTFAGLCPLILETSIQAKFLIPMAVSLSFGVIFATLISLILVPAAYLILDQFINYLGSLSKQLYKKAIDNESVEDAYQRGYASGSGASKSPTNPYSDDVLSSSWEAGLHDAKQNLI